METNDIVEEKFESLVETVSDINEHLRVLRRLSSQCNSVVEMGVRGGVSTFALLAGRPKTMFSFDINPIGRLESELIAYSQMCGCDWFFHHENVLTTSNITECDMIFIDTYHAYKQLSCELFLHGNKAKKYLVFHDTQTFRHNDELGRLVTNDFSPELLTFVTNLQDKKGLYPAIQEFQKRNPEWKLSVEYNFNNGLMILQRQ